MKYEAYLEYRPAKWNTWNYVVRITDPECKYKVVYFSESAPGKPPVDILEGAKGYIEYQKTSLSCTLPFWESQIVDNEEEKGIESNETI